MMVRIRILGVLFLLMMIACKGGGSYHWDEYKSFVDDETNGFIQSQTVGEFKLSAKLLPSEYIAALNMNTNGANKESFYKDVKTNRPFYNILFRIEGLEQKSEDPLEFNVSKEEYQKRLGYMMSFIDDDLKVVVGDDTLDCIMHHLERSYHMTSFHNIQCVFEKKNPTIKDDIQFVYDDQMLNIGKVTFKFDKSISIDTPTIIF